MLVFPHWRSELPAEGCRMQRWAPPERLAPYLARPAPPPPPPQYEDEDSSGGSSPERNEGEGGEGACGWRNCCARFPSVARLSAHVARTHAHAHTDGLFYCGWKGCSRPQRGFNARYKMLVHVRTHTNERPHTCNQCYKSFSRAENLKIHLRSHSGEKPYVCPYEGCGKAYSNSSDRFKHTRTHSVEKPYCCKVAGCNKRYTDPSSLRKHVKTYKHFTTEQMRRESSEEAQSSDTFSPNTTYVNESISPLHTYVKPTSPHIVYSPRTTISPVTPYSPVLGESLRYAPVEHVTYVRPLESIYPVRVPSDEMSYMEYTHMYDHAYRNYYSMNYPVLRPSIDEKVYTYEEKRIEEVPLAKPQYLAEEMPLNLITKRLECKPIEELVRRADLPLDLSTKS